MKSAATTLNAEMTSATRKTRSIACE